MVMYWSLAMKWNTALFLALIATTVVLATRTVGGEPRLERGREVFDQYCLRCHGSDGSGGKGPYNIRGREIWKSSPRELIRVLAFGASGRTEYGEPGVRLGMPPAPYSNEDLAAVAMYAMKNIGGRTVQISAEDVALVKSDQRKTLKVDTARGSTAR
jgi:mono/diheme cytochrome c family protein